MWPRSFSLRRSCQSCQIAQAGAAAGNRIPRAPWAKSRCRFLKTSAPSQRREVRLLIKTGGCGTGKARLVRLAKTWDAFSGECHEHLALGQFDHIPVSAGMLGFFWQMTETETESSPHELFLTQIADTHCILFLAASPLV